MITMNLNFLECPAGTAWNHKESRCDWLDNVDCTRMDNADAKKSGDDDDGDDDEDEKPKKAKVTKKPKKSKPKVAEEDEEESQYDDVKEKSGKSICYYLAFLSSGFILFMSIFNRMKL